MPPGLHGRSGSTDEGRGDSVLKGGGIVSKRTVIAIIIAVVVIGLGIGIGTIQKQELKYTGNQFLILTLEDEAKWAINNNRVDATEIPIT